jgi:hypothetical protein
MLVIVSNQKLNGINNQRQSWNRHQIEKTDDIKQLEQEIEQLNKDISNKQFMLDHYNQVQFDIQYKMIPYKTKVISKGWPYTYIKLFDAEHGFILAEKNTIRNIKEVLHKWEKADDAH